MDTNMDTVIVIISYIMKIILIKFDKVDYNI
jgi:hypothetical protein